MMIRANSEADVCSNGARRDLPATPSAGKTIAVMQPYLFPYIPYFQLIELVDTFVILDDVNYINRGWINRNNILLGGRPHRITLQLRGASQNRKINEIEVGDNAARLVQTIRHAYAKAPGFPRVFPLIESMLLQNERNLARYLANALELLCRAVGINTPFLFSSAIGTPADVSGQQRIVSICQSLGARNYINAIGGQVLYDYRFFRKAGVDLFFLHGQPEEYGQRAPLFRPGLSIIDAMMHCTSVELRQRLAQYSLV